MAARARLNLPGSAIPTLRKPLIPQQLPRNWTVSRVELHYLKYEGFILVTDLSFAESLEWFQLLRRYRRYDANDRLLCIYVGNLFVRDRERPEPLMLMHHDFYIVQFIAF